MANPEDGPAGFGSGAREGDGCTAPRTGCVNPDVAPAVFGRAPAAVGGGAKASGVGFVPVSRKRVLRTSLPTSRNCRRHVEGVPHAANA